MWRLAFLFLAACETGAITGFTDETGPDEPDAAIPPEVDDPDAAIDDEDEPDAALPTAGYHPAGFVDPARHGAELKQQLQDCRSCHGPTLDGVGIAPSCDTCHTPEEPRAWRSDCTFCHGGDRDATGAPPRGLAGRDVFPAHTAHVNTRLTVPLDCVECHTKPLDVLSAGHVFDGTPAEAEVTLAEGRSAAGVFTRDVGCATAYCHGNGQGDSGSVEIDAAPMTCASCHPSLDSSDAAWQSMSGQHRRHLRMGDVSCGDCHRAVTQNGETIVGAALHLDGTPSMQFSAGGFRYDAASRQCSGECHDEEHEGERW